MIIQKITVGFVVQRFDNVTGKFISQEFFAGDEITYEDEDGVPVESKQAEKSYLPFEMTQPA